MNNTLKATLALGAAGLSLLTLVGGASAQTTVGDPSLTTDFSTYAAGKGAPNYSGGAIAVGYDALGGGNHLPFSPSSATAQSVYEPFILDSSAAGTFNTIAAGSIAQIQLFALNNNVNSTGGATNPFNVYASLYAYDPNATAGNVPVTGPNLFGAQQKVTLGQSTGGYFSNDFTLAAPLVAGQSYVFGFTTLSSDTQDYAFLGTTVNGQALLPASDLTFDRTKFITDFNDQGAPTANSSTNVSNTLLAFRLNASAPVPEGSMTLDFGLGLGVMGLALVASKRRRNIAK